MRKKRRSRLLKIIVTPLLALMAVFTFIVAFEYTLVADIREMFSEVDKQEPLVYGELLFNTRGCVGCHLTEPGGAMLGPNLFGISERESEAFIREAIVNPNAQLAKGFASDIMPAFGEVLDAEQINALVVYLGSIK